MLEFVRYTNFVIIIKYRPVAEIDDCDVAGETEEREMQIRRRGEEIRIRLEQDVHGLIQELETNKNSRIKDLKKIGCELEEASVKLAGHSHQLNEVSVNGTDVDVIEECGRIMSATQIDPLSFIPEPLHHVQPQFTSSSLLQHENNLVGQLTPVDGHETRKLCVSFVITRLIINLLPSGGVFSNFREGTHRLSKLQMSLSMTFA